MTKRRTANLDFLTRWKDYIIIGGMHDLLATSDPAPGSLTPRQATKSPAIVGTKNCVLNSSDPNLLEKELNNG